MTTPMILAWVIGGFFVGSTTGILQARDIVKNPDDDDSSPAGLAFLMGWALAPLVVVVALLGLIFIAADAAITKISRAEHLPAAQRQRVQQLPDLRSSR